MTDVYHKRCDVSRMLCCAVTDLACCVGELAGQASDLTAKGRGERLDKSHESNEERGRGGWAQRGVCFRTEQREVDFGEKH